MSSKVLHQIFGWVGVVIPFVIGTLLLVFKDYFIENGSAVYVAAGLIFLIGCLDLILYFWMFPTSRSEAEEASKQFQQMENMKNDFLSIAQHQLRTPLSGVNWALESLLADPAIPLESKSLVEAGIARVADALKIVNAMLQTAETKDGEIKLTTEPVDIAGMVTEVIAELNFMAVKKSVKVVHITPQSAMAYADRNKIKAALINIIDNAFKYTPNGKVEVTVLEGETQVKITVKDNGSGIDPKDFPFIFDRLYRGKNGVSMEPDGNGIGLYTAKKIVELHGGTIALSSEMGKGTTVVVTLPKN